MVSWITTTAKIHSQSTSHNYVEHISNSPYIWRSMSISFLSTNLIGREYSFTHGQDFMRFWEVSLTLESRKYWFFMIRRAIGIYDSYYFIYNLTSYEVISRIHARRSHIAQEQQQEQHARIAINTQYLSFIILVFFCSISRICCLTSSTLSSKSLRKDVMSGSERAAAIVHYNVNNCPL